MEKDKAELLTKLDELQTRIKHILLEEERIELRPFPELKKQYESQLGELEKRLAIRERKAHYAQKRASIMRMMLEETGRIDHDAIERRLEEDFGTTEAGLDILPDDGMNIIGEADEIARADELFASIIGAVHPDMKGNRPPEHEELYQHARHAYRSGHIPMLRAIERVARERASDPYSDMSYEELYLEIQMLESAQVVLQERLDARI